MNENDFLLCKNLLLDGAQFIGKRCDVLFLSENIGKCFENEKNWPSSLKALIYLQVYIQKEKNVSNLAAAVLLKDTCLGKMNICVHGEYQSQFKEGFLSFVLLMTRDSKLINHDQYSKFLNQEKENKCIMF